MDGFNVNDAQRYSKIFGESCASNAEIIVRKRKRRQKIWGKI